MKTQKRLKRAAKRISARKAKATVTTEPQLSAMLPDLMSWLHVGLVQGAATRRRNKRRA